MTYKSKYHSRVPEDLTITSGGNSSISNRWSIEVRNMVSDYDFSFLEGKYNAGGCKCQFCGAHILYEAHIEGYLLPGKINPNHEHVSYIVGFDCLESVLGTDWAHNRKAQRIFKNLKAMVEKDRLKARYRNEYSEYIDWLESIKDLTKNTYIHYMYEIITTGKRFSKKVFSDMERMYKDERYSVLVLEKLAKDRIEADKKKSALLIELESKLHEVKAYLTSYSIQVMESMISNCKTYGQLTSGQQSYFDDLYERGLTAKNSQKSFDIGNLLKEIPF